jgi:hypothetical protein
MNNATQREKAEMLKQDRAAKENAMIRRKGDDDKTDPNRATTFFKIAQSGLADEAGGRFGVQPRVTGVAYPTLPASSPWAADPVPAEAPLGEDISAVEPTGTPVEIQASIARLERPEDD